MFSQFTYQFLLNSVVFSTLVLIVALALAILFRKSAATVFACSFGGLVFAFLVPLFCLLGVSVNQHQLAIRVNTDFFADAYFQQHLQRPEFRNNQPDTSETDSNGGSVEPFETNGNSPISASSKSTSVSSGGITSWSPRLLLDISILVGMITAVALLMRLLAAFIGTLQIYRTSDLVTVTSHPGQRQLIERLRDDRVTIRSNVKLRSAVAMQWPTRSILLPASFLLETSDGTIDRIIEHERAHILRFDHATLLLQEAITSVFWFNPLFHLVKRIADRAREDVCDNWVLAASKSTDYCKDLVKLSEFASTAHLLTPCFAGSRGRGIGIRVRGLLSETRIIQVSMSRRMRALIGTLLLAVCSIAFFAGFSCAQNKESKKRSKQEPTHLSSQELMELAHGFSNPKQIIATVVDRETGEPIANANVKLLNVSKEQKTLGTAKTDMAGGFEFRDLDQHGKPLDDLNLVVIVSHDGHSSQVIGLRSLVNYLQLQTKRDWQIKLGKSSTLTGRITDNDGKPIAGFNVWQPMFLMEPVGGVLQCMTGDDGRYEIKDHHEFNPRDTRRDLGNGGFFEQSGTLMMAYHPKYGRRYFNVPSIPGNVDLEFERALMVNGRVIDKVTGKPIPGLFVTAKGYDHDFLDYAKTNSDGKFVLALIPTTQYDVWVSHSKLDAAAQKVAGASGQTVTTKDFELESLVSVKGRVLDDRTGKPLTSKSIEKSFIHCKDDARPATTSGVKSAPINEDGSFELRVLPGTIVPYFASQSFIDVSGLTYKDGLIVTRENPIELEFRVREREDTP